MSDVSQGPGWWQASDGKWYPPESAPAAAPAAGAPPAFGAPTGPPPGGPPAYGAAPAYGAPAYGAPVGGPGTLVEWPQRVLATVIDGLLLFGAFVVVFIVGLILGAIADALGALVILVGYLAILAGSYFYFPYLTGQTGQSPGKKLVGIQVVAEATGQPIGGGMGIARQFVHILDGFCLIGYLFPLWDAKKQTFADKILNTIVIPGPKASFSADIFKP